MHAEWGSHCPQQIYIYFIFEGGASKKFINMPGHLFSPKSTHACQQNFNSFHNPIPLKVH